MSKASKVTVGDQQYYGPVVLRVEARDESGRPSRVTVGYDDTTFDLNDGAQFITAYVHVSAIKTAVKRGRA